MTRAGLTEKLLDLKREKGWTWKYVCEQIGGMSPIMITGAILGQHKLTKPQAAAAAKLFGLSKSEQAMLNEVPMRGTGTPMPQTDPLIYRFYELILVNGPAWKALIEEEFGDGIMSAIDFDMEITPKADPKGDRVSIGMTGKFLPYKYYGATGNALAYGLKEEYGYSTVVPAEREARGPGPIATGLSRVHGVWVPAGACHRAALRADPLAGTTITVCALASSSPRRRPARGRRCRRCGWCRSAIPIARSRSRGAGR